MVVATLRLPRRGTQSELDRLYRRHADEVLRYAQLVLRSRPDAEDVLQTTFVRAFRALERGERVQKPRNWLIKIAHNECRRFLAARKLHVELPDSLPAEVREPGRAEELSAALSVLAPAQRQALVLRELEGRSYSEIAEAMDLSASAVETLIFRARRAVREQLELGVSCEEFPALLEAGDRARVRAHTRVCADCATLERQERGRKSALRRLAGSFFFPKFVAAVFATGAAVTVTVTALPDRRPADLPPLQVDRPAVVHVVVPPRKDASDAKKAPESRKAPGTAPAAPRAAEPEPIPPGDDPLPVPEPTEPGPPPVPAPPIHEAPTPTPSPAADPVPAPVLPLDPKPVPKLVTPVTITQVTAPVVQTVTPVVDTVAQTLDPVVQAVPPVLPQPPPLPPVLP